MKIIDIKFLKAMYKKNNFDDNKYLIKWFSLQNEIITQIDFKLFKFKYRIMELYNFQYYRDDYSETMLIIIKSIDEVLEKLFSNENEIIIFEEIKNNIKINEIYKEFIEKILNEEKPDLSNLKIINLFENILSFMCQKFKTIYNELKEKYNLEEKKMNLLKFLKK